eukprot:scaffold179589_cov30-Tisochrysis_lutea.AAC.8
MQTILLCAKRLSNSRVERSCLLDANEWSAITKDTPLNYHSSLPHLPIPLCRCAGVRRKTSVGWRVGSMHTCSEFSSRAF